MRQRVKSVVLMIVISFLLAICLEGGISFFKYCKAGNEKGKIKIENNISTNNIEKNGEEDYVVPEDGGEINITLDNVYLNKFEYSYITYSDFACDITFVVRDGYNNISEIVVSDESRAQLSRSVINVGENIEEIIFKFGELSEPVKISDFLIDNSFKPSPIRMVYWGATFFLVLFFATFLKKYKQPVENIFVVCALIIGVVLLLAQPPHANSWDEHIHFANCYFDPVRDESGVESEAGAFINSNPPNFDKKLQSIEERIDEIRYLNNTANMPSGKEARKMEITYDDMGYLFQMFMLKLGTILELPFYCIWILGKTTNLVLYCVLMFFAIKITPIGKVLLAFTGLLPTTMILTASYTYDITVTGCVVLAMSIIIKAFYFKEKVMPWKERGLFCVLVLIASCPKQGVYLPLLLLLLLLPSTKFYSKKEECICKSILIGCVIIGACLVLYIVLGGLPQAGDARGGNTNLSLQVSNILHHPVAYIKILFSSVASSIFSMEWLAGVNRGGFVALGYAGNVTQPLIEFCLLLYVWLTDSYSVDETSSRFHNNKILKRERGGIISCIIISGILIFTALYVWFTEVGSHVIEGVQARYFLPMLWGGLLAFQPVTICNKQNKERYCNMIISFQALFLMYNIYVLMITQNCI
uniref:DUF2142 domain-containing protein n=1 Tax=Lachnoclostridium phocaeense TaxID=1871021 RepID=UPI0026DD228B|nr:DUF2142 domain-containing protein [Lachnoclostridium phocaeense]